MPVGKVMLVVGLGLDRAVSLEYGHKMVNVREGEHGGGVHDKRRDVGEAVEHASNGESVGDDLRLSHPVRFKPFLV